MNKIYSLLKIIIVILFITKISYSQTRTVDGDPSDWVGTPGTAVHSVVISQGEWIYKGKAGDQRTDYNYAQASTNNDITEVRIGTDGISLFFLVRMSDITNITYPHLCFVLTNGTSTQNFIGDQSNMFLGSANQHGIVIDVHYTTHPCAELYDGGSWYYDIPAFINADNDVIEFKVSLSDLGLSSTSITNISFMSAPNNPGWNNDVDGTAWPDNGPGAVDVMTPNSGDDNAWGRDVLDSDVDFFAAVNLSETPLPVELSTFSARVKENNVQLSWITKTEINSYLFEVEKKTSSNWVKIGEVTANGNSNSEKHYSFNDNEKIKGSNSYRLKMIYNDGSFEYSKIIEVDVNKPERFDLMQNYPNPFNPSTTISFNVPEKSNITLKVFDMLGNEVANLLNEVKESGTYSIDFNAANLSSGIYYYTLSSGTITINKKMILMK